MAKRNRIIYPSQSVHAEGRILYRVQTLGADSTFNTQDMFELGQLELTEVVDDNPEVAVTLETMDYGSVYTMATLAKVPTANLHHNIRQSDGVTFIGDVGGTDTSTGSIGAGVPSASGTGIANLRIKETPDASDVLAYVHGVQLIDFGRECGVSKGVDIWAPVQAECSLGTTDDNIEFTLFLQDVFINSVELNYQSDDVSAENYGGETEKKRWFLNDARFLSAEIWEVGDLAAGGQIDAATFAAKADLTLSLAAGSVPILEDSSLGFLKKTGDGRPAVLFTFKSGGGLSQGESKFVPVFTASDCIPSNAVEYFIYSAPNTLTYYNNGLADTLDAVLPSGRSAYLNGDKVTILYVASEPAKEVGDVSRPGAADAMLVDSSYFSPIGAEDVEDLGGIRQGQIEAYLVDPGLILQQSLLGGSVSSTQLSFSGTGLASNVDLTRYVGLPVSVVDGAGKGAPARRIVSATNDLSGDYNNGSITLGGSAWGNIRLIEDDDQASTVSGVYVEDLCSVDADFAGSSITLTTASGSETTTIDSVDVDNKLIVLSPVVSGIPVDGSEVLVNSQPVATGATASTVLIGDYELALRLQNVTITADLTREPLKEIGHLDPYVRTLTVPINFTVTIDTTAADLETFATFAGKKGKFLDGTLTDLDLSDLFTKDDLAIVVMIYQQNDTEAGGTGIDRRVQSPDMFGDDYWVDGVRNIYTATDGSLREYPLKTVIVQNLRPTDEGYTLTLGDNATQSFGFRGTNQLSIIRGYVGVNLAIRTIESQGE